MPCSLRLGISKAWQCAGEWGGQDMDSAGKTDATWHTAFVAYMQQLGATDQFYWSASQPLPTTEPL